MEARRTHAGEQEPTGVQHENETAERQQDERAPRINNGRRTNAF
jgi:hypothetical protein